MDIFSVINICGGLAFFLFGMNSMGRGLSKISGGKLEKILEKVAGNPIKGVILGMFVTCVIQSSSATTVMVVGFVNSGIMALSQATGIIMGASIGTTITAWILSLTNISSESFFIQMIKPNAWSPILALIGVIMILACKNRKKKDIGEIFVSFAILIFGMTTMSSAFEGITDVPGFAGVVSLFANPVFGIVAGVVITAVMQSSSASIGVLQALSVTGTISLASAVPFVVGANIGASTTALISCIGANKNAKRAAFVNLYYKLIGAAVFLALLYGIGIFADMSFIADYISPDPVGIAVIHSFFNILSVLVLLPFSKQLEKLARISVRSRDEEEDVPILDDRFLSSPSFAIEQCRHAVFDMAKITKKTLFASLDQIMEKDEKTFEKILKSEDKIDKYEDVIGTYLVKLSTYPVTEKDSREISKFLHVIGDFERIGDHAENILDAVRELSEKKINFSEKAAKEIGVMTDAIKEIINNTFTAFTENDVYLADKTEPLEQTIDRLQRELKDRHIRRLKEGRCTIELGFIFSELLTAFERISDHCSNIAVCIIQLAHDELNNHMYLNDIKAREPEEFKTQFNYYKEKYKLP